MPESPFELLYQTIIIAGETFHYYNISLFDNASKLPFSIRVLLESAIRNAQCDGDFQIKESDVMSILNWERYKGPETNDDNEYEIPFKPARVILQDANGVPAGNKIFYTASRHHLLRYHFLIYLLKSSILLLCVTLS